MTDTQASYVITCGDEGVQINEGTRLSFAGAGLELPGFSKAVVALKKTFGSKISIAASQENDWVKTKLKLADFEQADASMQQQVEALADREKLDFIGFIPFTDPKKLGEGIKGHMVRPKGVHIANKICFTLGGGENIFNLGCFQISADWLHAASPKVAEEVIMPQIEYYRALSKRELPLFYDLNGSLGEKIAQKNLQILEKIGLKPIALPGR
ncbi:MAG: hypothetical protein COU63_04945 [Candidatus Pacebacteria bacterium CG10_big_fil_rev_8_21_14_0_10_36_11]|nr:hypothetical protein [Candidatus Pacearchaeota archaeon]OIP73818.1 MAG: hypothetical protein AUK08_04655 [Candidatus Pacebacteria bacterium CG2_30_36_39]PIR64284.1 MAG: hypothetical protein COU63_04945 [Candidatus Pacebacteria bacterium CG10_big_fil_rev_8_21_14_0_10_36_11]PJC42681.1 MAG: hypothetical protein CO040_03160 [Candidatus Pacebacteria bacterium CG_4_9_14_0_2_um_filter_36_8]